jgi:hypothetical protein
LWTPRAPPSLLNSTRPCSTTRWSKRRLKLTFEVDHSAGADQSSDALSFLHLPAFDMSSSQDTRRHLISDVNIVALDVTRCRNCSHPVPILDLLGGGPTRLFGALAFWVRGPMRPRMYPACSHISTCFAAVHESAYGTKRTSRAFSYLSAFGGKADIAR